MTEPNRRTGPASPILQIAVEPATGVPLHRQVYDGVRDAIVAGRLAPGGRLPSSRVLASDLGVGRNTVLQAYEQLRSEGYVTGRRGGGTRVREVLPDALLAVGSRGLKLRSSGAGVEGGGGRGATSQGIRTGVPPVRLSRRGAVLVEAGRMMLPPGGAPMAFELGVPAVDAFPARVWSRLAGRRWRRRGIDLGDADPAGERALREAIAAYVSAARGAQCMAEQVLVMNGAQQALHVVSQVLLDPGDAVWMEEPGYIGARLSFAAAGARIVPVAVDAEGLDVAAGAGSVADARLAYVTPSHQFPLGVVMSAARRLQLLSWARRSGAWIVEDDYDSEFRYAGRPLPCLQGLDARAPDGAEPRVLYIGTFSKTLVPGLRLGYLVVPEALVDAFRAVRSAMDRHAPTPYQAVLADFIGEGHYTRHLRQVRSLCAERQDALLVAADSLLAGRMMLSPDVAGLHLVARLTGADDDDRTAASRAAAAGVRAASLSRYFTGPRAAAHPQALLLGYAAFDAGRIREGVERLARALDG